MPIAPATAESHAGVWRRAERFFATTVWQTDPERLPRARGLGYRVARVLYAGVRTFFERDLPTRAAALTYYTVLSLVPFLAFAFSMVKGLGAYDSLVAQILLPRVQETFAGNPQLRGALEQVFAFVAATDVTSLGALGAGVLVYTSVGLMRNIGAALNAMWGAPDRPLLRELRDYVTITVLAPIVLTVAGGLIAAATASSAGATLYVREALRLGFVIDVVLALVPLVVVCLALFLLYLILPNLRVRARSAAVGAAVGGVLWYGALLLHVRFQLGVASYNALYASFGALPIFLLWIYVSWLTVLIGGGVAAGHQNTRILVQQMRARGADERFHEALALTVMALIGQSFLAGEPRWTREALAARLDVSDELVDKVLCGLAAANLAAPVVEAGRTGWVLGRDADTIRVKHILAAMRRQPSTAEVSVPLIEAVDPRIREVLDGLDRDLASSPHNLALRELVARIGPPAAKA